MNYTQSPNITSVSPFTISPSDTIRWKAFGGASNVTPNPLDTSTAASNTEIISIDTSVNGKLAAGAVAFLQKPFDEKTLLDAVAVAHQRVTAARAAPSTGPVPGNTA